MNLLITLITDLIHFLKFIVFSDLYFAFNKKNRKFNYLISFTVIIMSSVLIKIIDNNTAELAIYLTVIWISLNFLFDEKKIRIFISGAWMAFISAILDAMSTIMVEMIFVVIPFEESLYKEPVAAMLSLLFVYVIGRIIRAKNKNGFTNIKTYHILIFTILAIVDSVVLILSYIQWSEKGNLNNAQSFLYGVSNIFAAIGIFIQLAAVIILIVSRNEHIEKERIIKKYLDAQNEQYKYLEFRERETKKFRHDLKSHMHLLKIYCDNNEYNKFNEYFDMINLKVDNFTKGVSVNNDIVDAIINRYYAESQRYNIKINVEGHFPKQCSISVYDLCTIFSNLLSNAMEASIKSEKKEISVICKYDKINIIIIISNYYSGNIKLLDNKLVTMKNNKELHGFGFDNVNECVEKNGGYIEFDINNKKFMVKVLLKNE